MSGQHTQGRLVVRDTWLIQEEHADRPIGGSTDKEQDRDYYASIVTTVNGKYHDNHANARRFAACWNACRDFDTDLLINIDMMGDTLKQRFEGLQAEVRRVDKREASVRSELAAARTLLADLIEEFDRIDTISGERIMAIRAFLKGQP